MLGEALKSNSSLTELDLQSAERETKKKEKRQIIKTLKHD